MPADTSLSAQHIVYQLVTNRQTYAAPTTTVNRTAVADATVLATLAQIVGTLIADLRAQGVLK